MLDLLADGHKLASMRPRHMRLGYRVLLEEGEEIDSASMRPRRMRLGY